MTFMEAASSQVRLFLEAEEFLLAAHYVPWMTPSPRDPVPYPGRDRGDYWAYMATPYGGQLSDGSYPYAYRGGMNRERPPQADVLPDEWSQDQCLAYDMRQEVDRMVATGLRTCIFDLVEMQSFVESNPTASPRNVRVPGLGYDVAHQRNLANPALKPFTCMPMPDMTGGGGEALTVETFTKMIKWLSQKPAAHKTSDGSVLVAPFTPEHANRQPSFYKDCGDALAAAGVPVAWLWCFQDPPSTIDAFAAVPNTWGVSAWGSANPGYLEGQKTWSTGARVGRGIKWVQPVRIADYRPREGLFEEAEGSRFFDLCLKEAVRVGASGIELITWNDYAEGTQQSPEAQKFVRRKLDHRRNQRPNTDFVSLVHRRHHFDVRPTTIPAGQPVQTVFANPRGGSTPVDNSVWVYTSLTRPARVVVSIAGVQRDSYMAPAGELDHPVPFDQSASGQVSVSLRRLGQEFLTRVSDHDLTTTPNVQDLTYYLSTAETASPASSNFGDLFPGVF